MKKLLLISNTGTKNVVGLVQRFQAEARRKHISLERELINVGLIRKVPLLSQMRKRKFKPYKLNQPVKHVKTKNLEEKERKVDL